MRLHTYAGTKSQCRLPGYLILMLLIPLLSSAQFQIPDSDNLKWEGDIASRLIDSCDAFLLQEIKNSMQERIPLWHRDLSSMEKYTLSIAENRRRFAHMIGVRDDRIAIPEPEICGLVAEGKNYRVQAIRWPVMDQVHGEGLLIIPNEATWEKAAVVIPDADQSPEEILGISGSLDLRCQTARIYAEQGYVVIVPTLINRQMNQWNISNREFIYRSAYELGRHIIGYEVQKILAANDWFSNQGISDITVSGWGEGGLLAFYTGAIDTRVNNTEVSGYFGSRQRIWEEPAYRNVFGLLKEFGDAEIGSLIAPRHLVIHSDGRAPEINVPTGVNAGKPGILQAPDRLGVNNELDRLNNFLSGLAWKASLEESPVPTQEPARLIDLPDHLSRHQRQLKELDRFNQWLLQGSKYVRDNFMSGLNYENLEAFKKSTASYREYFAQEVIGEFDQTLLPFNVRSRPFPMENRELTAFEVVLDVFPGLFAYGLLILPPNLEAGEQRPVVVCQHGLEGRPQSTIGEKDYKAYKAFASRLAERGYITFAPQNIYIFEDRFRTLQFKANSIKKTLFSLMVPQHRQITEWLSTLPFVDSTRIAFYGLSYGGKSAMRIPPLVSKYCLSICSADFNEWVWKNASSISPYSYIRTGEYEIFEWDLGSTFNYAEMATLIAPRPFMVERGHFDGVAPDEMVAHEYAKVRHLYNARLNIGDRTEIEWFAGPHTINGKGTFDFLDKHLKFTPRN